MSGGRLTAALVCATLLLPSGLRADGVERGRYLLAAAGCAICHTDPDGGAPLAGGRPLVTPFGTFYTPNITPHPEHGLGRWSEAEFAAALREGVGPGGHYYPAFPFTSYTRMRREDVHDLWAYLRTVPAVARPNREHELPWYLTRAVAARLWKWLFFDAGELQPDPRRSAEWNRGAYLVQALGHCGECHSPRNPWGSVQADRALAGNPAGPEGEAVPNLTPERETGLGRWSAADIAWYLETGGTPDGDFAGSVMGEVIEGNTRHLTPADRRAIAVYLRALPPVANPALRKRR